MFPIFLHGKNVHHPPYSSPSAPKSLKWSNTSASTLDSNFHRHARGSLAKGDKVGFWERGFHKLCHTDNIRTSVQKLAPMTRSYQWFSIFSEFQCNYTIYYNPSFSNWSFLIFFRSFYLWKRFLTRKPFPQYSDGLKAWNRHFYLN